MAAINKHFLGIPNLKIVEWLRRPTYAINIEVDLTKGYAIYPTSARKYSSVTIKAIPNEDYKFVRWSDGNVNAIREIAVIDNVLLEAIFDIIPKVKIIARPNDEAFGSVVGSGEYNSGTEVALKAYPNENYVFVKWNDGSTERIRTVVATEDKTYIAEFEDIFGTLTYKENY